MSCLFRTLSDAHYDNGTRSTQFLLIALDFLRAHDSVLDCERHPEHARRRSVPSVSASFPGRYRRAHTGYFCCSAFMYFALGSRRLLRDRLDRWERQAEILAHPFAVFVMEQERRRIGLPCFPLASRGVTLIQAPAVVHL